MGSIMGEPKMLGLRLAFLEGFWGSTRRMCHGFRTLRPEPSRLVNLCLSGNQNKNPRCSTVRQPIP